MTPIRLIWLMLALLWVAAEIVLDGNKRFENSDISNSELRSRRLLWLTLALATGAALIFKTLAWMPIPMAYLPRQFVALLLFAAGLGLRYKAVKRLGRFFSTQVNIQNNHELITDGPYRHLRHPAYTGLLIALAAAGLAMGDGLALLLLTVPLFCALSYRIDIEEKMMTEKFGTAYRSYCESTRKLLPWLY